MANLDMLSDDWGAKGAQMTGAQVQQIIKDALKQCAKWATEPEEAVEGEEGYVVINVDGVPKKISVAKLTEMIDEQQGTGVGKQFINELFGLPTSEESTEQ